MTTAQSRDVSMATDSWRVLAKIETHTHRLHSLCWNSTTVGSNATRITALIRLMMRLRLIQMLWTLIQWPLRSCSEFAGVGGAHTHACIIFIGVPDGLMFIKRPASIELFVGFITVYWNYEGSLKGRYYGNRFVPRVGENWHTPSSLCALAFHNGWKDRNVDCCINTAVDPSTSGKNFVNFGSITPES